jgi:hypothetical protein
LQNAQTDVGLQNSDMKTMVEADLRVNAKETCLKLNVNTAIIIHSYLNIIGKRKKKNVCLRPHDRSENFPGSLG